MPLYLPVFYFEVQPESYAESGMAEAEVIQSLFGCMVVIN